MLRYWLKCGISKGRRFCCLLFGIQVDLCLEVVYNAVKIGHTLGFGTELSAQFQKSDSPCYGVPQPLGFCFFTKQIFIEFVWFLLNLKYKQNRF